MRILSILTLTDVLVHHPVWLSSISASLSDQWTLLLLRYAEGSLWSSPWLVVPSPLVRHLCLSSDYVRHAQDPLLYNALKCIETPALIHFLYTVFFMCTNPDYCYCGRVDQKCIDPDSIVVYLQQWQWTLKSTSWIMAHRLFTPYFFWIVITGKI